MFSASSCAPCALFLTSVDHLTRNRDTDQPEARVCRSLAEFMDDLACPMSGDGNGTSFPVVVVATASDVTRVVSDVRSLFLHQVNRMRASRCALNLLGEVDALLEQRHFKGKFLR